MTEHSLAGAPTKNTTARAGGELPNDFRTHTPDLRASSMSQTQRQQYTRAERATIPSRPIDLAPLAHSITSDILHCRDGLPHEANGRPKAPSNPRAAQIRKQMAGGISDPVMQLATVTYTDLEDGVPYHIATAGLTRLLTFLKVHADAMKRQAPRSIVSAWNHETRQQHAADLAQHRVILANACDEQTLRDCIGKSRAQAAALEEVAVACEAELASRHSTRLYALKALAQ